MNQDNKRIIITGGPGSGKTTLLKALEEDGGHIMPEAGRAIIKAQKIIDGPALPEKDPLIFAEHMLSWDIRNHDEAGLINADVFFDRGIPDIIGYLRLMNLPIAPFFQAAALHYPYYKTVFIAPFWEEIYACDEERKQDKAEARTTCQIMEKTYSELGYLIEVLPKTDIVGRVDFIRSKLAE